MSDTWRLGTISVGPNSTLVALRKSLKKFGWKSDAEALARVKDVAMYSYGGAVMFPILRGVEAQLAGKGAHPLPYGAGPNEYSVEHIFPQTPRTPPIWVKDLAIWAPKSGPEAVLVKCHCLGNLTAVTNYDNSRNGRKRFVEKVRIIKSVAPIKTNESLTSARKWTVAQIDKRTVLLAAAALQHWPVH